MTANNGGSAGRKLRSRAWFDNPDNPDMTALYLGLVEVLNGYPLDGVVLTTGCDKTTPSQIMAASTVDIPAIVLSGCLLYTSDGCRRRG